MFRWSWCDVVFVVVGDLKSKDTRCLRWVCVVPPDPLLFSSLWVTDCSRTSVSKNIIQHKDFTLQQTNLSGTNSLGSDGSRCENTFRLRAAIRSCVSSKRHTDNTTPPTNSLRQVWSSGCFRQLPLCREAEQRRCSITWRLISNQGKTLKACL